jgi:hypothetical protein
MECIAHNSGVYISDDDGESSDQFCDTPILPPGVTEWNGNTKCLNCLDRH